MSQIDSEEKKEFSKKIGENIREYRDKRGLTLRDLAQLTSYSRGYIGMLEKAKGVPNSFVLKKLSEALNVPISAIYGEEKAVKNTKEFKDPILTKEENKKYVEIIKEAATKNIPPEKIKSAIKFIEENFKED